MDELFVEGRFYDESYFSTVLNNNITCASKQGIFVSSFVQGTLLKHYIQNGKSLYSDSSCHEVKEFLKRQDMAA